MNEIVELIKTSQYLAVFAAPAAAALILLTIHRAWKIYILAFQYFMVSWLVVSPLPLESALAKLVAGWIAAFILYLGTVRSSLGASESRSHEGFPRGRAFRLIAVLLVVIGTLGVSFETWMSVDMASSSVQQAAMLLAALGILGIGLSTQPLQVGISLITVISGFEIIYSSVEPSLAIVALFSLVHLGVALVVSYFEIIQTESRAGGGIEV